jgi:hypothetical protein
MVYSARFGPPPPEPMVTVVPIPSFGPGSHLGLLSLRGHNAVNVISEVRGYRPARSDNDQYDVPNATTASGVLRIMRLRVASSISVALLRGCPSKMGRRQVGAGTGEGFFMPEGQDDAIGVGEDASRSSAAHLPQHDPPQCASFAALELCAVHMSTPLMMTPAVMLPSVTGIWFQIHQSAIV